jgi:hypothetical protein
MVLSVDESQVLLKYIMPASDRVNYNESSCLDAPGGHKSSSAHKAVEKKGYDLLGYHLGVKSKYNTIGFKRYNSFPLDLRSL